MKFEVKQIASLLDGTIIGDDSKIIYKLNRIEDGEEGGITFLFNAKYAKYINSTKASVVVISEDLLPSNEIINTTIIKVKDAYISFLKTLEIYENLTKNNSKKGIHQKSDIHESVDIKPNTYIGAFVVIDENVVIEDNVKIYPNTFIGSNSYIGEGTIIYSGVNIYNKTKIGKNCVIHSGTVIGSDGFGFIPNENGVFIKVPQTGNVVLEDNVEIGSNSTIDRATLGSTLIKSGVKLDNQIQVGHNVQISENSVIASQSGIAGSTKIGKNVIIGGQVGVSGHLNIPDGTQIQAQSGVNSSPKEGITKLYGSPAIDASNYKKSYIIFKKLPQIAKIIADLEKKLS